MRGIAAIALLAAGACARSGVVECGDGRVCPEDTVCAPLNRCVTASQLLACVGLADDAPCTADDINGICVAGVCTALGEPRWRRWLSPWPARAEHAAAFDADRRRLIVFGGATAYGGAFGSYSGDTWERDEMGVWSRRDIVGPEARRHSVMTYDADRKVVVLFGGQSGSGVVFGDTWEYDGTAWRSTVPASAGPGPRFFTQLVYDPLRRRVVMYGGNNSLAVLDGLWEYDGTAWTQRTATNPPGPSYGHASAYDVARQRLILVAASGVVWELPHGSATWINVAAGGPAPRVHGTLGYVASRGTTVMFAGTTTFEALNDAWAWNGISWTQLGTSITPAARQFHTLSAAADELVLVGGQPDGSFAGLDDVWRLRHTGTSWSWERDPPPMRPASRGYAPFAYDTDRDKLLLFGGFVPPADDTWWFGCARDDSEPCTAERLRWNEMLSATTPPGRFSHAMAYDPVARRTVMFGGIRPLVATVYGDTWAWDDTSWAAVSSAGGPSPRFGASAAFDPTSEAVILFGGRERIGGDQLGDTWELVGASWREIRGSTSPAASSGTPMGTDPELRRIILIDREGATWAYASGQWSRLDAPIEPRLVGRIQSTLVYDRQRAAMLLYGGAAAGELKHDLWELADGVWREIEVPGTVPLAAEGPAVGYHAGTYSLVVFGGLAGSGLSDETWLLRPEPSSAR